MSDKKRRVESGENVIFVDFASGKRQSSSQMAEEARIRARLPALDHAEPVSDVYTAAEVSRLTGLPGSRLRSLDRAGVVAPSGRMAGRRAYTFRDLIVLRTVQGLLARRVKMREVAMAVRALRGTLPRIKRPLAELRIVSDGRRVVVRSADGTFEPLTGQMLLDFDVRQLRDDVVRVLRPRSEQDRLRVAFEIYERASRLDEDPNTFDEAASLYRRALELDPTMSIAFTNLGNIQFRRGREDEAVELYHRALDIDPAQAEAQYNLGYLLLDRGHASAAIPFFEGAVQTNGLFADAHFYLAMAYESVGDRERARPSWMRYLQLDPTGTWADIARRHL
jgi:tetratricopeptide (TPR) repeat protein